MPRGRASSCASKPTERGSGSNQFRATFGGVFTGCISVALLFTLLCTAPEDAHGGVNATGASAAVHRGLGRGCVPDAPVSVRVARTQFGNRYWRRQNRDGVRDRDTALTVVCFGAAEARILAKRPSRSRTRSSPDAQAAAAAQPGRCCGSGVEEAFAPVVLNSTTRACSHCEANVAGKRIRRSSRCWMREPVAEAFAPVRR